MDFNVLSLIIFLPVVGALLVAFIPRLSDGLIKRVAAVFTFIPLVLAMALFFNFDKSAGATGVFQFQEFPH